MTTSVGSTTTHPTSLGAIGSESTQTSMDSESFMRLLVAQIQHQDPLQPMDTSAMMGQLTQLTEVERLVAIDGRLEGLAVATASVANAQAADLVGRTVEADTSHMLLQDGVSATGSFQLDRASTTTRVEIRDGQGNVVRTMELGAKSGGSVHFDWDGNDDAGNRMPAGQYGISVTAADADGNAVSARTRVRGAVGSISYEHGYPELTIGDTDVLLGDVRSIEDAPPPAATTPTTSGSAATTSAATTTSSTVAGDLLDEGAADIDAITSSVPALH